MAVPMEPDQELVFGWMGLNPALLLDQPDQALDQVVVRVIRPGEDAEAVLDEARQQLAAAGGRRRRRGRGGAEAGPGAPGANAADAGPSHGVAAVDITPLPEPSPYGQAPEPLSMVLGVAREETPQRERDRQPVRSVGLPAAEPPSPEAQPSTDGAADQEEEDSGEPRRRRRRSSATA